MMTLSEHRVEFLPFKDSLPCLRRIFLISGHTTEGSESENLCSVASGAKELSISGDPYTVGFLIFGDYSFHRR